LRGEQRKKKSQKLKTIGTENPSPEGPYAGKERSILSREHNGMGKEIEHKVEEGKEIR